MKRAAEKLTGASVRGVKRVLTAGIALGQGALDCVYPRVCAGCGACDDSVRGRALCPVCADSAARVPSPVCNCCGIPITHPSGQGVCSVCLTERQYIRHCRSIFVYDGDTPLARAILAFKHGGTAGLAIDFAELMAAQLPAAASASDWDLLVAVPIHASRFRQRGYNQAQLLAGQLGKRLGVPSPAAVLLRQRATPPQHGSRAQRRRNVRGAFAVRRTAQVKDKRILLIDDVLTTGATLRECARMLLNAAAASVDALTLARVLRRSAPSQRS